ncbi:MAG TPA: phospholipid carrier-dependent glycosyltransferase [Nitrososphaeraceae archaeon]|nr:phospholipid carrier-dependent glycosyltransferase [Nitrososphaeraceae archaeon]
MEVLNGLGPQESKDVFPNPIDHPYFGQIFLAGALRLVGYPNSISPSTIVNESTTANTAVHVTEMLWLIPRVLMGLLAVADTFLIYKIAERRYNSRTVALIASILFAVMPLSWMTRRIFLESIQLPIILLSILAAVYLKDINKIQNAAVPAADKKRVNTRKQVTLVLVSGIFLGLAVFTKVPVFTMIPAVGFLVYTNVVKDNNTSKFRLASIFHINVTKMKMLGLWLVPVILIPLIWPIYSIAVGYSFDFWLSRVVYQGTRLGQSPLEAALYDDFTFDPVFITIGLAGLIFSAARREYFLLLWALPFLLFLYEVHWALPFHLVPLFPFFSIAAAVLIVDISNRIRKKSSTIGHILPFATISAIAIFGLVSTIMLITTNINSSFFEVSAFVAQKLSGNNTNNTNNNVLLLGPHPVWGFFWIPKYVLNENFDFRMVDAQHGFMKNEKNAKVMMISDSRFARTISKDPLKQSLANLRTIYLNTNPEATFQIKPFPYDTTKYPYINLDASRGYGWWNSTYKIQVRTSIQTPSTSSLSSLQSPSTRPTATSAASSAITPAKEKLPDAVEITSPYKGQQISVGKDLKVSGTSIDNSTSTCSVLVNLNGIKPNQNAVAAGNGGSNDYSKWNAFLTSKYASVKQGNNKINARINCSDIHGLAMHFNLRNSVNVLGVP